MIIYLFLSSLWRSQSLLLLENLNVILRITLINVHWRVFYKQTFGWKLMPCASIFIQPFHLQLFCSDKYIFSIEETSSVLFIRKISLKTLVGWLTWLSVTHLSAWGVAGLCLSRPLPSSSLLPDFASNLSTFLVWTVMLSFAGILSKDVFSKLHSAKFKEVFFWGRESVLLVSFSYQLLEFSFLLSFFFSVLESKFLQLNASFWY